ncbi:hypothetical protein [Staphylococcus saprophyticus]|uniref:hypothetical protein n=1 Tax=Staphylococcus saprophyticus TaxID=29385 RepID=UPI001D017E81|nr:hypothetical protein [Staphylococcus saprophyticus]
MNVKMLPMFLTLAGYVGAMIGSMQLVSSFNLLRSKASKPDYSFTSNLQHY